MLLSVTGFAFMQLSVKFLQRLPPTELVLFRSIISLLLSLQFIWRKKIPVWGVNKKILILRGLFGVTALSLFFFTLQQMPMASAVTIQYLSPIFTAIFGIFWLGERVKPWQWLFFGISFTGILLVKGFDPRITPIMLLAGVISSAFAGLAYNCIRILRTTDHPVTVVLYFPLIATPVMLIWSIFNWVTPVGVEWLYLLLMGLCTQVGQVYMTKAVHHVELNAITSLKYLGIIYAIGFDILLFDIGYSVPALAGMVLVVFGVLLNILLKSRKTPPG